LQQNQHIENLKKDEQIHIEEQERIKNETRRGDQLHEEKLLVIQALIEKTKMERLALEAEKSARLALEAEKSAWFPWSFFARFRSATPQLKK